MSENEGQLSPPMQKVLDRADQLRSGITDEDRWAYVRDELARKVSVSQGGRPYWGFVPLRNPGTTFTGAIDAAIRESREQCG